MAYLDDLQAKQLTLPPKGKAYNEATDLEAVEHISLMTTAQDIDSLKNFCTLFVSKPQLFHLTKDLYIAFHAKKKIWTEKDESMISSAKCFSKSLLYHA